MNRGRRRLFFGVAGAAAILTALFAADMVARWGGLTPTVRLDDLGEAVAAFLAALICGLAAIRRPSRPRLAWTLLALSAFSWGLGECVWSYYELLQGQTVPFPSLADAGYLGAVPLALAGILLYPAALTGTTSRLRTVLDGLIIAGAMLLISWATVLGTIYRASSGALLNQLIGLAYPIGDIVIGTAVLAVLTRASRAHRAILLLIGAGMFANLVSDSAFEYLTTVSAYGPAQPVDAGWLAGYLLISLAALWALLTPPAERAATLDERGSRTWLLLPYVPVSVAAITTGVSEVVTGGRDSFLFWNLMVLGALLGLRQFIMLADNIRLSRSLEARTNTLQEREEHFRSLVQNSSDVVTVVDAEGTIRYQSASTKRVLGFAPDRMVGTRAIDLLHPDDRAAVADKIRESLSDPSRPVAIECRIRRNDGTWCPCEVTITNLIDLPSVRGLVLNTRDITERKALEEQLTHQAFHDSLTNLANRAAFRVELDHAVHDATPTRRIAVLFLDLDDFKTVNDTLGHDAGDLLLKAVAERIAQTLRPNDLVARLGGDEFAILLSDVSEEQLARRIAERISKRLAAPIRLEGKEVIVQASIGIAGMVTGQEEAAELLKNADVAMYVAKATGKARFVEYQPSLHRTALEQMELQADLRLAVQRNELVLDYQPIVRLEDGMVYALEALVRWNHPERGRILPADFIPAAERNGMILDIERWVLERACAHQVVWQSRFEAAAPSICVNLFPRQVQDQSLSEVVSRALDQSGTTTDHLVLEVTEAALMGESESVLARIAQLRDRGVRIAIDHFGTGYSPLGTLREFPVDILKIDHSFTNGILTQRAEGAIARAILGLANSLGLVTIAEGIERFDEMVALRAMHCQAGQGLFIAPPMPAEKVESWLAACTPTPDGLRAAITEAAA